MGNQQCLKNDDSKPRQTLRLPAQNEDFTLSIQTVQKTNEVWKQLGVLPIEESFMRDNQIGSYLMEQEKSDYCQRAEVWQKAIQNNKKDSKQNSDCDTCSSRDSNEKFNDQFPHCQTELDKQLISSYINDQKAFKQLVRDGAPLQRVRWSSWQIMVNTNKIERILQQNILDVSQWSVKQETIISINKDVDRTTTQHQIYFSKDSEGYEQLNYALVKLAKTFKDIQYVQGMNFIVGFVLLISTDKNSTYQFMVRLMINKKFLMYFMFAEKMPLLKFLEYTFEQFLKTYSQDIYNQIYIKLKIPPILWLTKIFITLFLYSFPIHQCIKFWDFILSSNIFQTISILCAFLRINQPIISKFQDQGDFMIWFDTIKNQKDIVDGQKQLEQSTKTMLELARKLYVTDKFIQKCAHDYPYKEEQEFTNMLFLYPKNVCEFIAGKIPHIIQRV